MHKQPIIIVLLLLCVTGAFAQKQDVKIKVPPLPDSLFTRYFDEDIALSVTYSTYNQQYRITGADGEKFVFTPNEIYETDISAAYSFLTVRYTFSPKFLDINNNEDIKGTTEREDFEMGFALNRFDADFDYSNIKGFYLHNTADFNSNWKPGMPYTMFPAMRVRRTGGYITYNTNRHFATGTFSGGDEQQLRTAFTLLPTLYVCDFKIKDSDDAVEAGEDEYTKNLDIHVSLPLAANIVFAKNWHCALQAGPSIGIDACSSKLVTKAMATEIQRKTTLATGYTAAMSIGWGNRRFFAGINGDVRNYQHAQNGSETMQKFFYNASIYVGMRLKPPGFVKRSVAWVKSLLPFDLAY